MTCKTVNTEYILLSSCMITQAKSTRVVSLTSKSVRSWCCKLPRAYTRSAQREALMQGIKAESTLDGSREHLAMTECLTRLPKVVQQLHIRAQLSVYLQRRLWNPCHCRLRQFGGVTPPYSLTVCLSLSVLCRYMHFYHGKIPK